MEHDSLMCELMYGQTSNSTLQEIFLSNQSSLVSAPSVFIPCCKQTNPFLRQSPLTNKLVLMLTDSKLAPPFDSKNIIFLMCGMVCFLQWLHVWYVMAEFVMQLGPDWVYGS